MSDLARWRQIRPASAQLPVSWYFDPEIFALEKKLLFDAGANYVGHELMVPEVGDFHTLAWSDDAWMLVRNREGDATSIELLSNVCRHRQSIMLRGRGNAENIVCPLHRWTYDLKGELLGAPHFPESPCVRLQDRKSTRLNSSHMSISYAVFCLKKKKNEQHPAHHHKKNAGQLRPNRVEHTAKT